MYDSNFYQQIKWPIYAPHNQFSSMTQCIAVNREHNALVTLDVKRVQFVYCSHYCQTFSAGQCLVGATLSSTPGGLDFLPLT